MKRLMVVISPLVALLLALSACKPAEEQYQPGAGSQLPLDGKLTVEQASQIIGLSVPAPTYLPDGYRIAYVELHDVDQRGDWNVTLTIKRSDAETAQTQGPVFLRSTGFLLGG